MTKTFLDMDCVLADFIHHFNTTIEHGGLDRAHFDDYKKHILEYKDWWYKMPPMPDAHNLVEYLAKNNHDLWVLSAAPEWHPDATTQKKRWVNKYFPIIETPKIVITRRELKKNHAKGNILVDDYGKNIREWKNAGGVGIHHKNTDTSIRMLENIKR